MLAISHRAQPGFESAFVMDVDDDAGQQQHLGFVQFSSAGAAAAAQEVGNAQAHLDAAETMGLGWSPVHAFNVTPRGARHKPHSLS